MKQVLAKQVRILAVLVILVACAVSSYALPSAPTVTLVQNSTAAPSTGALVNTTGGSITTMVLNATSQNYRWKAYVGNVTGELALSDAQGYSVFDWSLTEVVGEVYATRSSEAVLWSNINCSTSVNISNEEFAMNHTSNAYDNITATFDTTLHREFYVGSNKISNNSCRSLHTNVNDTNQSNYFEEILLHDGESMIYATILETDAMGYRPDMTYDFQMIIPERGLDGWTSSTAYYFYVELI